MSVIHQLLGLQTNHIGIMFVHATTNEAGEYNLNEPIECIWIRFEGLISPSMATATVHILTSNGFKIVESSDTNILKAYTP